MLMNGFDGQITTARSRGSRSAASTSGCARAAAAPSIGQFRDRRLAAPAHEIVLEVEPALASVRRRVRTVSSLIGTMRVAMPSRRQKSAVMADRLSPAASRRVRSTWVARSPSPSWNQVSPPSAASAAMKVQVSSRRPQPRSRIVEAGERVHQGVEIGRDGEPQMLEVVAGIGDHQQVGGRQDAAQARARAWRRRSPPDSATTQRCRLGGAHRNRSSSGARISAAAGDGRSRPGEAAHQHRRPRLVGLSHQQRGGAGDLVGKSGLGHAQRVPEQIGPPAQVHRAPAGPRRRARRRRCRAARRGPSCR